MRLFLCAVGLGLSVCWLAGCSSPSEQLPDRVKVAGKVQYSNKQPLQGGTVSFQNPNSQVSVLGTVAEDGSFQLYTLGAQAKEDGAPPGKYKVTIMPQSQDQSIQPITLPQPVEIQAGKDNSLTLTIPKK